MIIRRNLRDKIIKKMGEDEIIVILGSRQVGKTTLMRDIESIIGGNTLFIDLEDLEYREIAEKTSEFIKYLETERRGNQRLFVFLDEIQYLTNPSNLLKIIHDHHPSLKLIVSGSSSFRIRSKFQDSLAGRKRIFTLYPLSFDEYLRFRGESKLEEIYHELSIKELCKKRNLPSIYNKKFVSLFNEFLIFGGYPKESLRDSKEEKIEVLKDIYQSYIEKDIKDFLKIESVPKFNNLLQFLSVQSGGLVSFGNISGETGIARKTLERYLMLLEKTFVITVLRPFYRNRQKEITKTPKIYFQDSGIRNFSIKDFRPLRLRDDKGKLAELSVLSEARKSFAILQEVYFWRTQYGQEVDFIIRTQNDLVPGEIKYRTFNKPNVPPGMKSFIKRYNPKEGFVGTTDFFGVVKYRDVPVYFSPSYLFSKMVEECRET